MKNKFLLIFLFIILVLLMAGCTAQTDTATQGGFITGVTLNETTAGQNANFVLSATSDGQPFGLDFWGSFTQGSVNVELKNQKTGEVVFDKEASGSMAKFNEVVSLPKGDYDLLVVWSDAVQGTYDLEWAPNQVALPKLTPMIFLSGAGMFLVGLGFLLYAFRKGGWRVALLGGAFWAGTVLVKFTLAGSFNGILYQAVTNALPGLPGTVIFSIYIGLLTGITEVLITWLILKKTKFGKLAYNELLSFSIGFGAIEALLLGLLALTSTIATFSMADQLAASQLRNAAMGNNFFYNLAPILERFFTIGIHIASNLLLFYAVRKNEMRWFWYSFAFKSAIDAVAGYAQLSGQLESLGFLWIIEAVVVVFGLAGFWIASKIGNKLKELEPQQEPENVPV